MGLFFNILIIKYLRYYFISNTSPYDQYLKMSFIDKLLAFRNYNI